MRRPEGNGQGPVSLGKVEDPQFKRLYPLLFEYLTCDTWDDGTTRETSTLLLFVDAGVLKGCVNDRAMGRNLFVAAESLSGLLGAANEALGETSPGWRATKTYAAKKGGKK